MLEPLSLYLQTNPGPDRIPPHKRRSWQTEVTLGTDKHGQKRDGRQGMLLHTATNRSPMTACRELLTLEQSLDASLQMS